MKRRWIGNLSLCVMGFGLRFIPYVAAFSAAVAARAQEIGILNRFVLPGWLRFAIAILALDGIAYALHRLLHALSALWRLHAVHHSDPEFDLSTGVRHHPLEVAAVTLITAGFTVTLGASPDEFGAYATLTLVVQLVAHANLRFPERLEAVVEAVVVTPRFHEVHHSPLPAETDSNYGQMLSIWDRFFGTTARRAQAERVSVFGLSEFREARYQSLQILLAQPFLARVASSEAPGRT